MEEILNALELKKELDALRPIDKEQEAIIMQKFRLDWNYHSNHLEGNALTYGETKALILFGVTAQGKTLKDHFEITGHNEAINWVIDMVKRERPLTENFIRELHELLLKESYEVDAITPDGKPTKKRINVGKYKSSPNHVQTKTGEIFHFSTPEDTPARMTDLLNWYKEKLADKDVNPIFLAAEFHYRFIRIHPFDDGNGRTARILMNFILMQFGFPPVIIKSEDKENYFIALQLADAGNIESFIAYIAKNFIRSLEIMIAGGKGESVQEPDDLDKEIALLEQRLISVSDSKVKSIDLFVNSLFKFIDAYLFDMGKFSKLYQKISLQVSYGDYPVLVNMQNFRELVVSYIDQNKILEDIALDCSFYRLKGIGFEDLNYDSFIRIIFNENNSYEIMVNFENSVLNKLKLSPLTDKEIAEITKLEVTKHKEFIEQKISGKQN